MQQIATTIEQSKNLLELGLGIKSADMCLCKTAQDTWFLCAYVPGEYDAHTVPAWSLSALLEVMCYCHDVDVEFRKDKNLGWICKWTFYDFDNKKRLDLSKCGETKIEAAFEIIVTLFVQGLIKKGVNNE